MPPQYELYLKICTKLLAFRHVLGSISPGSDLIWCCLQQACSAPAPMLVWVWTGLVWAEMLVPRRARARLHPLRPVASIARNPPHQGRLHVRSIAPGTNGLTCLAKPWGYYTGLISNLNFGFFKGHLDMLIPTHSHSSEVEPLSHLPLIIWSNLLICYIDRGSWDRWGTWKAISAEWHFMERDQDVVYQIRSVLKIHIKICLLTPNHCSFLYHQS